MDSRDIICVNDLGDMSIFVFRSGGVLIATEIAVSLFREVQALRYYGNKDCIAMSDKALDEERKERG